jgi:hypothetical protein
MDGDADLEEAHRIREERIPCVPPLVYLWDPGEVDPPASSRPQRKFSNFQIFSNLPFSPHLIALLRHNPVTSPPRHLSQLHRSTNNFQHRPQIFVVLELTTKVPRSPVQRIPISRQVHGPHYPTKPPKHSQLFRRMCSSSPSKSKLDLYVDFCDCRRQSALSLAPDSSIPVNPQ